MYGLQEHLKVLSCIQNILHCDQKLLLTMSLSVCLSVSVSLQFFSFPKYLVLEPLQHSPASYAYTYTCTVHMSLSPCIVYMYECTVYLFYEPTYST